MWNYTGLIRKCRKYQANEHLRDKFVILEWRLMRRAKRLRKAKQK